MKREHGLPPSVSQGARRRATERVGDFQRKTWRVDHLDIVDEPMIKSLVMYDHDRDRQPAPDAESNVVSSELIGTSLHGPIIDLDFPHVYVPSTAPGHAHLYLNVPISRWRLFVLLWGLYVGGVIEMGNFWWSLRRGGTNVRRIGVPKTPEEASVTYTWGMFWKLRKRHD